MTSTGDGGSPNSCETLERPLLPLNKLENTTSLLEEGGTARKALGIGGDLRPLKFKAGGCGSGIVFRTDEAWDPLVLECPLVLE